MDHVDAVLEDIQARLVGIQSAMRQLQHRVYALQSYLGHGRCDTSADEDSVCGGVCETCRGGG